MMLAADFRLAVRALARRPGFTLSVALGLAIGIGITTALFALLDAVLLRPLPVERPQELVALYSFNETEGDYDRVSGPDLRDYETLEPLSGLAVHNPMPFTVVARGTTERVWGEAVSGRYFDLLKLPLGSGRGFLAEEDAPPEGRLVAVVSEGYRRRVFGDGTVLGESVKLNGKSVTIVGVAPPGFHGINLELGMGAPPDLWIPFRALRQVSPQWADLGEKRDIRWLQVMGRLAPGWSLPRAEQAVRALAARLAEAHRENRAVSARLVTIPSGEIGPNQRRAIRSFLAILMAFSAVVFLVAIANAGILLLFRASERRTELAIRTVAGAGPTQIARQLLVENLLLLGLGLVLAPPITLLTQKILAAYPLPFEVPLRLEVRWDLRVLGFAVVLTGVAGFLFGVLPALRTARGDLHDALRSRPGEAATARSRLRSLLIGSQVTLSLVLLTGSGLLLRTLERSLAIDSGFDADRVLMLSVDFNANRFNYDAERGMAFYRQALERVRTLSGVESATWAADVPLVLVRRIIINFIPDNRPEVAESDWITADCDVVGPDHLKTLGIRLLAGRDFTQQDGLSTPEVAIVNETLARRYWPGENPVGKRFKVSGRTGVRQVEVVGLSRDVRQRSLHQEPRPFMYLHLYQRYFPEMTLYVRTSSDPAPYLAAVRRELSGIDPELPIFNARLMRDQLALALSRHKVAAALLSASSLVALVLSALGVYAVTSYGVARRRGEIGLRLALGAGEGSVLGLVVRDALRPAAVGLAAGIVACLAVTPLLKNLLWGVSEKDAASFGASAALLVAVVLLAAYLPARRALAVDPASSLRSE